jgi:hypothetical protein
MSVKMRIRVEVEVDVGTWGTGATFAEIADQVRREGTNIINAKLAPIGRVIGRPSVLAIIVLECDEKGGAK